MLYTIAIAWANHSWFAKLKPVLTINDLLAHLLIHQLSFAKCSKRVNSPNFPTIRYWRFWYAPLHLVFTNQVKIFIRHYFDDMCVASNQWVYSSTSSYVRLLQTSSLLQRIHMVMMRTTQHDFYEHWVVCIPSPNII